MLSDDSRTTITDEFMRQMRSTTKQYCVVNLEAGPNSHEQHAGRNRFVLLSLLPVVLFLGIT
jgi:hypothetical protein